MSGPSLTISSFSWNDNQPQFLREELFELVDEWCEQLFGTSEKPEAAAYELARLAANHAAIEALYSIRIRMGDHTYRYQEDDGSLTYERAEQFAFDGLTALEQREREVEREACCKYLNDEVWDGLANKLRAHRAVSDAKSLPKKEPSFKFEVGSTWKRIGQAEDDSSFWTVIYGGYRVIGRNPQGHKFRSSPGVFLRNFVPFDASSVFTINQGQ